MGNKNFRKMSRRCLIECNIPRSRWSKENKDGNLIIYEGDKVKSTTTGHEYIFLNNLGHGAFGHVYFVMRQDGQRMAMKVSSDFEDSYSQSLKEKNVLGWLSRPDTNPSTHLGTMIESFVIEKHVFIVLPFYQISIYDFLSSRQFAALPLFHVQKIIQQLCSAVEFLHRNNVLHTDIKPENIMFASAMEIKLIDFGACVIHPEDGLVGYFQSLFYRAPEVILRLKATDKIDVWSIGCVAVELALGLPIFAGVDELNVLQLIGVRCGKIPHDMIEDSPVASDFFDENENVIADQGICDQCSFGLSPLETIIREFPNFAPEDPDAVAEENAQREIFISFVTGLLNVNPDERFSINNAINHSFLQMPIRNIC